MISYSPVELNCGYHQRVSYIKDPQNAATVDHTLAGARALEGRQQQQL